MPRTLARCTFFYEISIANYLLNKSHYFWGSDPLIIVYDDLSLITRFLSVGKGVSNKHHKIYCSLQNIIKSVVIIRFILVLSR